MELSIISLSDIQTDPATGRPFPYGQRLVEIIGYATLADRRGLDVFALAGLGAPRQSGLRDCASGGVMLFSVVVS